MQLSIVTPTICLQGTVSNAPKGPTWTSLASVYYRIEAVELTKWVFKESACKDLRIVWKSMISAYAPYAMEHNTSYKMASAFLWSNAYSINFFIMEAAFMWRRDAISLTQLQGNACFAKMVEMPEMDFAVLLAKLATRHNVWMSSLLLKTFSWLTTGKTRWLNALPFIQFWGTAYNVTRTIGSTPKICWNASEKWFLYYFLHYLSRNRLYLYQYFFLKVI